MKLTILKLPNLDAMEAEELREFSDHFGRLALYAMNKASAIDRRQQGRVVDALRCEALCEQLYQTIPDDWRW
jgi:hypothetical protein